MDAHQEPIRYHELCPLCGSTLITNGHVVWCTFVGGRDKRLFPPCAFRATLRMEADQDKLIDHLASLLHASSKAETWALFSEAKELDDGASVIPAKAVKYRLDMSGKSYDDLSEFQKSCFQRDARALLDEMTLPALFAEDSV